MSQYVDGTRWRHAWHGLVLPGQGKGDGTTPEKFFYTAIEWLPGREALEFPSCSPDKAYGPVTHCWTGIFPILGLDGPGVPYHEFGHG